MQEQWVYYLMKAPSIFAAWSSRQQQGMLAQTAKKQPALRLSLFAKQPTSGLDTFA